MKIGKETYGERMYKVKKSNISIKYKNGKIERLFLHESLYPGISILYEGDKRFERVSYKWCGCPVYVETTND